MGQQILGLLAKWLVNSLALFVAAYLVKGVVIYDFWSGMAAGALLGIVNTIIRPVVLLLTLPITIVTLGFFTLIINALMLKIVGWAIEGFAVKGFWAAFWGALVISVVSWLINMVFDGTWHISYTGRGGKR